MYRHPNNLPLHSFPTRRSSDLNPPADMPPLVPGEAAVTKSIFGISSEAATQVSEETRAGKTVTRIRSEEHTSELQSLTNLVCRLLLEKKTIIFIFGSGIKYLHN